MRVLQIQLVSLPTKERVRIRSGRRKNIKMQKRKHLNPINKASLPQIPTRRGTKISRKKKCAYCKKLGHEEHECYLKKIDELTNIMKKHNVPLPNAYKDKESSSDSKGKGQALMAN